MVYIVPYMKPCVARVYHGCNIDIFSDFLKSVGVLLLRLFNVFCAIFIGWLGSAEMTLVCMTLLKMVGVCLVSLILRCN